MKKALALLTVGMTLGFAGQAAAAEKPEVDPSITDGTAVREFNQARSLWRDSGVVSYRMKVSRSCYCVSPHQAVVTVRLGKVARVSAKGWIGPRTVPAMFRVIGQAIKSKVATLDVSYHPRLGFAKRTSIDYIAMAIDDEIGYRITGFKRLPAVVVN
ncbi:MAG: hypothetical protein J0H98_08530 [Solirubrobacterales bacterium]|nr:hypothetical protein [Solirubrobacterales bacterium]